MALRRVAARLKIGRPLSALEELPQWVVLLAMSGLCALALVINGGSLIEELSRFASDKKNIAANSFFAVNLWLLLVRDIGIILFFSMGKNAKREMLLAFVILLALHVVLPIIFYASDQQSVAYVLQPYLMPSVPLSLLIATAHAALGCWIALRRYQSRFK